MSLRDKFIAVRSIEGLRHVIASKDSKLRSQLAAKYDEMLSEEYGDADDLDEDEAADLKDHRKTIAKALDRIIMSKRPPAVEHGDWSGAFEVLADLLGLRIPGNFPIDSYKHTSTWAPYRQHLRPRISPDADKLLAQLEGGRPLRGSSMKSDWAMYAWLNGDEIACLHGALAKMTFGDDHGSGLAEFHKALLASLKRLRKKSAELLMVAD